MNQTTTLQTAVHLTRDQSLRPLIGATYEGRAPELLDRLIPLVDCIECGPDSVGVCRNGEVSLHMPSIRELQRAVESGVSVLCHGVGLSIGSHEGWYEPYLQLLDAYLEHVPVKWLSEHLGYTRVDGAFLSTMLTLPRTNETLNMICDRVSALMDRYQIPFLLENVAHMLPDPPSDYSVAEFLNTITKRTGCGLVLDAYNLECDAHNFGFEIEPFLDELNMANVREVHTARGTVFEEFLVDVHSRRLHQSTIDLAQQIVTRADGAVEVVLYELLPQALNSVTYDGVIEQMEILNQVFRTV